MSHLFYNSGASYLVVKAAVSFFCTCGDDGDKMGKPSRKKMSLSQTELMSKDSNLPEEDLDPQRVKGEVCKLVSISISETIPFYSLLLSESVFFLCSVKDETSYCREGIYLIARYLDSRGPTSVRLVPGTNQGGARR